MRVRTPNKGFTLIEILVVIVIIATVLSMAVLSVGLVANDKDLQTEGRRFAALMEVLNDEATMQGRDFGIEIMASGYRYVEYDPYGSQWADVPGDEVFRMRELPEDLEFELFIEDKRIALEAAPAKIDTADEDNSSKDYAPHLLVYSSGDVTPFELRITRRFDNAEVLLRGDALGTVEFVAADEDMR